MALSAKQKVFVEAYLRLWNATKAAKEARYAHPGQQGHRLLKNVEIQEAIQARIEELKLSADEVLLRLGEQARAEYSVYVEIRDGQAFVDLEAMKRDGKMHLIKGIKETKYGQQIEFYDAQTALVNVGRHHALFTDKTDSRISVDGPIVFLPDTPKSD
jgi:phage terminase small subunit